VLLEQRNEFVGAFIGKQQPPAGNCRQVGGAWDQIGEPVCPFDVEKNFAGATR